MSSFPSGWYPDPEAEGGLRWWDSIAWTAYRQPPGVPHSYAPPVSANSFLPANTSSYGQGSQQSHGLRSVQLYRQGSGQPYAEPSGPVALWEPLYGASAGQAFGRFWKKYADFTGRASKSEFWWAYLWVVLLGTGSYIVVVMVALGGSSAASVGGPTSGTPVIAGVLFLIWIVAYLGMVIPMVAVSVRRLHDAGMSGLFYLLAFVPFGSLVLLWLWLKDSNPEGAKYDRRPA